MKEDIKNTGIILLVFIVMTQVAFYKSSVWTSVIFSLGIFWLFVIPGLAIMLRWTDELDYLHRLVIGSTVAAAILGILSYLLGIVGVHSKYHIYLPILMIIGGYLIGNQNKK